MLIGSQSVRRPDGVLESIQTVEMQAFPRPGEATQDSEDRTTFDVPAGDLYGDTRCFRARPCGKAVLTEDHDMGEKSRKDKSKREKQKKALLSAKDKRKAKKANSHATQTTTRPIGS